MGKVELSIKEYDDLKDSLRIYKEIVEAITKASICEWELNSLQSGTSSYAYIRSNPNLSTEARDTLWSIMETSLSNLLRENGLNEEEFETQINLSANFDIGSIRRKDPEPAEAN